jgi:hypothetical protein
MAERICLVHIGTHKTGTTALQVFFQQNKQGLLASGVHVAETGRDPTSAGNHAIPRELLVDGTTTHFRRLLDELERADCRTALVTSEDFSLLHVRPEALEIIAEGLTSIGYRCVVAAFVRAQGSFAESLYAERIKHRYVHRLGSYLKGIFDSGFYSAEGTKVCVPFRYSAMFEAFARTFGKENVLARAYVPQANSTEIYKTFFSVLVSADPLFAREPVTFQFQNRLANHGFTYLDLLRTTRLRLHGTERHHNDTAETVTTAVREIAPGFPDELLMSRFSLITREETLEFLERFAPDNELVEREYGARIPFMSTADVAPENDPRWVRTRLQRLVFDRLLERWMAEADQAV